MLGWTEVVCLSVCLSVCLCQCQLDSLKSWAEISHKESRGHWPVKFFSDFLYLNLITSSASILHFRMRHSHGRIFFRFTSNLIKMYI